LPEASDSIRQTFASSSCCNALRRQHPRRSSRRTGRSPAPSGRMPSAPCQAMASAERVGATK
jgi:hypothetical protein